MKLRYLIPAAMLLLTGCSQTDDSVTAPGTVTSAVTAAPAESSAGEAPAAESIEVTALKYHGGLLDFIYEGEEHSAVLTDDGFTDDCFLSKLVINNRHGETVKAKLRIRGDLKWIFACDVLSPNGRVYNMDVKFDSDGRVMTEYDFTMHRGEGSKCTFTNPEHTVEADLNDLPMHMKYDYPETVTPVQFSGYTFSDGTFMLSSVYTDRDKDNPAGFNYSEPEELPPAFFGTVREVKDGRAEVLLNDGRTVIDIPAYYNDAEPSPGMEVMVRLPAKTSLFGSGGTHRFDYAVIYTDSAVFNTSGREFSGLAYAEVSSYWSMKLDYTFVS